jgi:hypothetical protein
MKKAFSLSDFDLVKKCEEPVEFELIADDGEGMDVFFSVIGGQAPQVQNYINKIINRNRRTALSKAKRGKDNSFTPIEEDIETGIEATVARMTGWRNITEEFNEENATKLCTQNPAIRKQIIDFSDSLANLTKA